jgi:hypothetical protein
MKQARQKMNEQQNTTGPTCQSSSGDRSKQIELGREVALDETYKDGSRQGRPVTNVEAFALDAWIFSRPPDSELETFRQIRGMTDASFNTWKEIFDCGGTGAESP